MPSKWDTDRVVSFIAILVGVGSLGIVVFQTQIMREQQRASVLPYLAIVVQSRAETTGLALRNAGIGPALLDDVRVRYKGKDFVGDPYDFFVQQRPEVFKTVGLSVDKLNRDGWCRRATGFRRWALTAPKRVRHCSESCCTCSSSRKCRRPGCWGPESPARPRSGPW